MKGIRQFNDPEHEKNLLMENEVKVLKHKISEIIQD